MNFFNLFELAKKAYFPAKYNNRKLILVYHDFAVKVRKEGLFVYRK